MEASDLVINFVDIEYHEGSVAVKLSVSADYARDKKGIRVMSNCQNQLKVAADMGCLLLTPKIVDIIHSQAKVIEPIISVRGKIVANSKIEDYSAAVDARIGVYEGLVSGAGKDWVLGDMFRCGGHGWNTAVNYGWHSRSAPYTSSIKPWNFRMWQTQGSAHDMFHVDPSQGIRLVKNQMSYLVGGVWKECLLENILLGKEGSEVLGLVGNKLRFVR